MRKTLPLLVLALAVASFGSGCASAEKKFGRGMRNSTEIVRMSDLRRTVEQDALFEHPEYGYTTGFIKGLNRTLARTGIGIYEMITAPIPPYGPVAPNYLSPDLNYPDNYRPSLMEDSMFATDSNLGFSGGDVAPMVPGSRFRIFDTH
jgi:putative exosortase-associated protein (TIGR04073 family)